MKTRDMLSERLLEETDGPVDVDAAAREAGAEDEELRVDVAEVPGAEAQDPAQRVQQALEELASVSKEEAEQIVLGLLQAVQRGDLPLSALMGYRDDDLFDLYEKAYTIYEAGRPKNAIGVCEGLLALNAGLPAVRLLLAACLMDLRQYDAALWHLDEALSRDGGELEAHLKKGHILYRQGRVEEASEALLTLLEVDPELDSDEGRDAARLLKHIHAVLQGNGCPG